MSILGRDQPWHEKSNRKPPRWSFLFDSPLWGDGREFGGVDADEGWPWRIQAWTPWGWMGVALTPGSRFVSSWNKDTYRYVDGAYWVMWGPR